MDAEEGDNPLGPGGLDPMEAGNGFRSMEDMAMSLEHEIHSIDTQYHLR